MLLQSQAAAFIRAGDVCGSGFSARRSGKVCALHTARVSSETLLAYWNQLPPEHRTALFSLPRHDFEAELDSCCRCCFGSLQMTKSIALDDNAGFAAMAQGGVLFIVRGLSTPCLVGFCSMQLRICKDCRYNVLAQYKLALSAGRKATGHGRASADGSSGSSHAAAAGGMHGGAMEPAPGPDSDSQPGSAATDDGANINGDGDASSSTAVAVVPAVPLLPVCEGFSLSVTDATVQLVGSDASMLLEEAEEIEDLKVCSSCKDVAVGALAYTPVHCIQNFKSDCDSIYTICWHPHPTCTWCGGCLRGRTAVRCGMRRRQSWHRRRCWMPSSSSSRPRCI